MTTFPASKKEKERLVFTEALDTARKRGGESRRLVDRIMGSIYESEQPDLIVRTCARGRRPPAVIGVEHFRVDHFSALQKGRKNRKGNQGSLAAPIQQSARKIVEKLGQTDGPTTQTNQLLNDLGKLYTQSIDAGMWATQRCYTDSMKEGFENHTTKASEYRSNVRAALREGEKAELAFLVEVHSGFSDMFVNGKAGARKLASGAPILFVQMTSLLQEAARCTDYLIFAFYPALSDSIVDAAVVNCRLLKHSLRRNKISPLPYFGTDTQRLTFDKDKAMSSTFGLENEGSEIVFRTPFEITTDAAELSSYLELMPEALRMRAEGIPFAASSSMQILLDVYGDVINANERLTSARFDAARKALGRGVIERRAAEWLSRWFPDATNE